MPMPSGRKIRPPIQAPLTTLPTNLTVCGQSGHGRYYGGGLSRGSGSVTTPAQTQSLSTASVQTEQQQAAQPPLITDTLTACLDVNGTYICTSYSPRCYIIQKVTANSLRVSPSTGMITGGSSTPAGTSRPNCLSPSFSAASNSSTKGTTTICDATSQHQKSLDMPYPGSSGRGQASSQQTWKTGLGDARHQVDMSANPITSSGAGRGNSYMNCEVRIAGTKTIGQPPIISTKEELVPPMGVASQLQYTLNSTSHDGNDTRSLNGVHDASRARDDTMMSSTETRRSIPGDMANTQGALLHGITNNNELTSDNGTEELRQTVLAQLEYYFSPDNLSTDKFLVSQMDSDQYVYISTIANFNMIKKLSCDLDLITNVLRESKHVQVHPDGKRVRPISNRTVVIVRGIPESTSIQEIKALFEKENSPRCNHCEFAFNDSWYLSFDSDDEAVRAHRYLREEVREFNGQPIMARIKSRPTTLLGPGMGVNPTKNGFHQPSVSLPAYIAAPYVPVAVSQTGSSSANASTTPIYATPQQVSSAVFTMPPNPYGTFGAQLPWAPGFYELNSSLTPLYLNNGLPSQNHSFQKAALHQMLPRHRTSKSESESFNGPPQPRGPRRTNTNGNTGDSIMVNGGHMYSNQRKPSQSHHGAHGGHGLPAPLLAMTPQTQLTNHISSHTHSHNHHNSSQSSASLSSTAPSNSHMGRNGHLHYSSLPPQSVPHVQSESFHRPPYRMADNRPRSSLGVRRGGGSQRSRDEERDYEGGSNPPPSSATSIRRFPSRGSSDPPHPPSPQPTPQVTGTNRTAVQTTGSTKFDLEVSSFPPLPGSANPGRRNGDSPYEGRLSVVDVVKGVKNLKLTVNSPEKEELIQDSVSIDTPGAHSPSSSSAEIVVSAGSDSPNSAAYVVSAASPTSELESNYKEKGTDPLSPASQVSATVSSSAVIPCSKKEFREVGVGSADDNQEVCASSSKELYVSGTRMKETADKSTQSVIVKTASTSTVPTPTHSKPFSGGTENNSKKGTRPEEDSVAGKKESISSGDLTKKSVDESCSTDDRGGPVRLSYAQAAQRIAANSGAEKTTVPSTTVSTPLAPNSDDGKKSDSSSGGRGGGSRDTRQDSQRTTKTITSGPPPPRGNSNTAYKRPPFSGHSGRRERIFSNGSTNRTGSSSVGSTGEHKN